MKRWLVLGALLVLFLLPIANPDMSSIPAAIVDEAQEAMFSTASDGDESSDSIELFAETLDDNVMFTSDLFENNTDNFGTSFTAGTWPAGILASTHAVDAHTINAWTDGGVGWIQLNFTEPCGHIIEGWNWNVYAKGHTDDDWSNFSIYNWNTHSWDYQSDVTKGSYTWLNGTTYDPDYWSGSECAIRVQSEDSAPDVGWAYLNCTVSRFYIMTLADSEHFGESFADISDITVSVGETVTTDGDLGTFHHPGDNAWDYYFWNAPSALAVQVIEWRCHANISSSSYEFALYSADDGGGSQLWTSSSITAPTSAATKKYSPMVTGVESIRLATRHASSPAAFVFDYLRGGLSTESGWAHDGSTTAGIDTETSAGWATTLSSDSDILTIQTNKTSETDQYYWNRIRFDDTATKANAEYDYYPLFAMRWRVTESVNSRFMLYVNLDDTIIAFWGTTENETTGWTTSRWNAKAANSDSSDYDVSIYTQVPTAGDTASIVFEMDWCKLCSIANSTLTQSGVNTDDYLYVDEGVLYSHIDDGYIELNHDPALSVADTYSVYNLTTSGTAPQFSQYVSAWSSYSDDTRGATTSGTVTDIKLKFDSTETLSAIKFIEDSTAPAVVRSSSTPNDPSDDEGVMLTAVVTDAVEVYKVYFDAIVSPAGFSDVPYYATEQTDNLWTYEFATLPTGPYVFKIVATDGANENPLTEYAYVELTVREAAITIEEITLAGAGSDFSMMTFSARINKDCSYVIYEESENNAEAATHSGSVSSPSFNLAWTKLSTTDTNVNFTIKFTNSTLVYNYTSQYQVAQTALAIDGDESLSQDEIIYSGTSTKACSWTLYLDSVQEDTGTISAAGSFVVNWTRTESVTPASISYAIKFYTATETIWENGTYDEYSLTAFSIQTLFMDLTDPSISAIFTTSWGNATGYLYEADVQKATGAEGTTLSYTKSTTAGTYAVALKIDAGGEVAWYNTTYTIATTELRVEEERIETSDTYAYCRGYLTLNADYKVYEETVEVATGSVTAGSIEIRWTKASNSVANVTVLFTSGGQEYPVYGSYQVAAQVTFVVESWWMDLNLGVESYVEFYVLSSFENATVYVYDNNTLMTTVTESAGGAYSYFWLSESEGLHTITLNITHGATVHTRTRTYYVPDWAATGLVMRWDLWTFQDNYTMLELESNWMNCTYYVYLNSSLVATSANDPVILNFTRAINIGEYNLTIYADAGTQTYTIKNIRYIITEEGVSYDYSSVVGGRSVREGDIYEGDVYEGDTHENPPGIYMTAETAATIAVSTVFIFFLAVLFMNSRVKKAQLDRDKTENQ